MIKTLFLPVFLMLSACSFSQLNIGIGGDIYLCTQSQVIDYIKELYFEIELR